MADVPRDRIDRSLLVETVLVFALIAAAVVLYWRPAADGVLSPRWWHWVLIGGLFFAVAAIHTSRVRQRRQRSLHREIREEPPEPGEREETLETRDR